MDQGKKLNIMCLQFKSCMLSEGFKGDLRLESKKNIKIKKNIDIRNLPKEKANILSLQVKIATMLSIKFSSVPSGKVSVISNLLTGL